MCVRGPNNVGRAVQTDPTLLRYASAITEQTKCWQLLSQKFDHHQDSAWCANRRNMEHPTILMLEVVGQQCCLHLHGSLQFS